MEIIKIVSRKSKLAQIQVKEITDQLPGQKFEFIWLDSFGDKNKNISLIGNQAADFFTRELDDALLSNKADIAIHSAKDLPYPIPDGLQLMALTKAFDKSDVLVSRNNIKLGQLPSGSKIGTSSETRMEQLKELRPDVEFESIRGTIEERLALIESGKIDALIVAACALIRLGLEHLITEVLPFKTHPLQGHLAIIAKAGNAGLWRLFAPIDVQRKYGKVTLAGFGPGDPKLLTLKTCEAIKKADAIFYDDLIDKSILENTNAQKTYVGKRKGAHSFTQAEINELLYQSAISGKNTLRLKGGDPFVFGRGGEEYTYLRERLVYTEVIPGVTSATCAAAFAGFPLTHRGISSSVALVNGSNNEAIKIPIADTLVYYMGAANLSEIANNLLESIKNPQLPVAIVSKAGSIDAKAVYMNLNDLAHNETNTETPALLFAGNVCKNSNLEALHEPRVLFTGIDPTDWRNGGKVTHVPLIEINDYEPAVYLFEILENIDFFDYVVFTSRHAVQHFMKYLHTTGRDTRHLGRNKIVSIGTVTSAELKKYGIIPDLKATDESSRGVVQLFAENRIRGKRVLIPRSDIALSVLPNGLRLEGNTVDVITVYSTAMPKNIPDIDFDQFDTIVFTSPSTINNFIKRFCAIPKHLEVVTRGNATQKAYEEIKSQMNYVI